MLLRTPEISEAIRSCARADAARLERRLSVASGAHRQGGRRDKSTRRLLELGSSDTLACTRCNLGSFVDAMNHVVLADWI